MELQRFNLYTTESSEYNPFVRHFLSDEVPGWSEELGFELDQAIDSCSKKRKCKFAPDVLERYFRRRPITIREPCVKAFKSLTRNGVFFWPRTGSDSSGASSAQEGSPKRSTEQVKAESPKVSDEAFADFLAKEDVHLGDGATGEPVDVKIPSWALDIKNLSADIRADIKALRDDLKKEVSEFKDEMSIKITNCTANVDKFQDMLVQYGNKLDDFGDSLKKQKSEIKKLDVEVAGLGDRVTQLDAKTDQIKVALKGDLTDIHNKFVGKMGIWKTGIEVDFNDTRKLLNDLENKIVDVQESKDMDSKNNAKIFNTLSKDVQGQIDKLKNSLRTEAQPCQGASGGEDSGKKEPAKTEKFRRASGLEVLGNGFVRDSVYQSFDSRLSEKKADKHSGTGNVENVTKSYHKYDDKTHHHGYGDRNSQSFKDIKLTRKLPKFDGTSRWETFYSKFVTFKETCEWSDGEAASRLAEALEGAAADLYSVFPQEVRASFEKLSKKLKANFGKTENFDILRDKLRSERQSASESLKAFARRVTQLAYRAYPGNSEIAEHEGAETLLKGCRCREGALHIKVASSGGVRNIDTVLKQLEEFEDIQVSLNISAPRYLGSSAGKPSAIRLTQSGDRSPSGSPRRSQAKEVPHFDMSFRVNYDGPENNKIKSDNGKYYSADLNSGSD